MAAPSARPSSEPWTPWLCDTGVFNAFALTSLCLVGPIVAWKTLAPRKASLVLAFATMCFGGLLVHFGQGPMQIEMHFYFFVLLGLLSIYANPMVIVVGEATDRRLERLASQAKLIAGRLGKEVEVQVQDHDLRLHPEDWSDFWAAFIHAIRNAVDHGIDGSGQLTLATRKASGSFVVELSDDGPGVNWDKVKQLAAARGMPHQSHEDLVIALFSDGLSTRDEVTETSGRGVGMAVLKQVTEQRGDTIEVWSEPGNGTTLRFLFPQEAMAPEPELMAA